MNTKKFYFITCAAIFLILFLLPEYFLHSNAQITRSGQALNIAYVFSIPYDISNTMRSPLAGPLSIILAGGLALIMMFGLFVAPLHYLFGTPERMYHYHDATKEPIDFVVSRSFQDNNGLITRLLEAASFHNTSTEGESSFANNKYTDSNSTTPEDYIPTFLQSAFFFLPEKDEQCKKLMVCHAHGFLGFMPEQLIRFYRFFSKRIPALPKTYQDAIIVGLDDQNSCQFTYDCSKDIAAIAKSTLFHIIPRNVKENTSESEDQTSSTNFV